PQLDIVEEAIFHPRKVTHVALVTARYEELFDFYTNIIGLSPYAGSKGSSYAVLRGTVGVGDLTLYRSGSGQDLGFHHVGFEVWDEADLDRALAHASAAKLKVERIVDHPARRSVTIVDPDGIRLLFYVNRQWQPEVIAS